MDFGREKEVFPLVLIQVKSAAKRTVFDLKNKREKTFLPFKTQLFHIQVVRYAASGNKSINPLIFIDKNAYMSARLEGAEFPISIFPKKIWRIISEVHGCHSYPTDISQPLF